MNFKDFFLDPRGVASSWILFFTSIFIIQAMNQAANQINVWGENVILIFSTTIFYFLFLRMVVTCLIWVKKRVWKE